MLFRLYHYIIYVSFNIPPNLTFQDYVYTFFICSSPVLEPERHLSVTENSERRDERHFFFIVNGEADLVIASRHPEMTKVHMMSWSLRSGKYEAGGTHL
jgi:hypothetical protein